MKAKVLKTERDYKAALAYVERLIDQPSPDEAELELWALLVENYEETHFPIAAPDAIEAIRFRMDQAGLQSGDLLPYLQSKSKISEVMNRKRPLSLTMIRALHEGLKIPAAVLVQDSAVPATRSRPTTLQRKLRRRAHSIAA
jgi:HTH-type transcriptional regulator/antitoxin HigA